MYVYTYTKSFSELPLLISKLLLLQIRATDSASVNALLSTMGTGDALKNKLNAKLAAQGLKPAIGVTNPVAGLPLMGTGSAGLPGWSFAWGMLLVLAFTLHC